MIALVIVLVLVGGSLAADEICRDEPADPSFSFDAFEGLWYEVGKIQTPGGAFWQQDCVCNNMNITIQDRENGDSQAMYSCRFRTPEGDLTQLPARLIDMREPGKWSQEFFPGFPTVSWTVILLGDDYAIQYDCGVTFESTEYCVHIVSRRPYIDEDIRRELVDVAEAMGLNPLGMEYTYIQQAGCWDN